MKSNRIKTIEKMVRKPVRKKMIKEKKKKKKNKKNNRTYSGGNLSRKVSMCVVEWRISGEEMNSMQIGERRAKKGKRK